MDLEGLLNASVQLEKRIATDKALRGYFSKLWKEEARRKPAAALSVPPADNGTNEQKVTLNFPPEMCELLELASGATGKTPSEILEESFVNYYLKKISPPTES